mmetsp:Transcript_18221/g.46813  ORF Transcript_18221/g.46813 Transcript_18221/m.46813 type:complete len:228 (-) Transcript_18221:185-868(-)
MLLKPKIRRHRQQQSNFEPLPDERPFSQSAPRKLVAITIFSPDPQRHRVPRPPAWQHLVLEERVERHNPARVRLNIRVVEPVMHAQAAAVLGLPVVVGVRDHRQHAPVLRSARGRVDKVVCVRLVVRAAAREARDLRLGRQDELRVEVERQLMADGLEEANAARERVEADRRRLVLVEGEHPVGSDAGAVRLGLELGVGFAGQYLQVGAQVGGVLRREAHEADEAHV